MRTPYFEQWRALSRPALLYLLHAALLTASLAISGLFLNFAILALGFSREFLGLLNTTSIGVAVVFSVPLWWLATRLGLRWGMVANAVIQAASAAIIAFWPGQTTLLVAVALGGAASVLYQVSMPPFLMRHSDAGSRDYLFSANTAINIGGAGVASLIAGGLPGWFGAWLGTGPESAAAYRATFGLSAVGIVVAILPLLLINEGARRRTLPAAPTPVVAPEPLPPLLINETPVSAPARGLRARIPAPYRALLRKPGPLLQLLVSPFLISCGAALLIPYLNLFFKERFSVSDQAIGAIFAALGIATGFATLVGPAISTRIGKIRMIVLCQALSIPFLLVIGFVPLLGLVIAAALVRAALFNMVSPLYDAFAMERTEEDMRPVVIGLINGAYTAGYIVAPSISTWTQANYGFAPLFLATTVCYALTVFANWFLFVRRNAA